jgi:hypothetical protein
VLLLVRVVEGVDRVDGVVVRLHFHRIVDGHHVALKAVGVAT